MAAHDDKISNNRRKLFKALSAAPVVATLRPGEALANASSLQCVAEARELGAPEFLTDVPMDCAGMEVCQVDGALYQLVTYWLWSDKRVPEGSEDIVSRKFFEGDAVVQMPASEGGEFLDITGSLVPSSSYPRLELDTTADVPPTLQVWVKGSNSSRTLAMTIQGTVGLAAEVYATEEGSLPERVGVFPKQNFEADNHPMNGSCMHSFAVAAGTQTITNG